MSHEIQRLASENARPSHYPTLILLHQTLLAERFRTCRLGSEIALMRMGHRSVRCPTKEVTNDMKWMRTAASIIGIVGSLIVSLVAIAFFRGLSAFSNPIAAGLWLWSPLSLIAATVVARRFQRIGGCWLVLGGVVNVALTVMWPSWGFVWQIPAAVFMLPAGSLWLLYASKGKRKLTNQEA